MEPNHILITGGAGFIGSNLAAHLLAATDARITLFDNLSHPGAEANLQWLRSQARASRLRFLRGDIRSDIRVAESARGVDEIYHLAGCSDALPQSRADSDVNISGTLNVLEAARRSERKPMVLYVSTSKVYRPIGVGELEAYGERLRPIDPRFQGISEREPADFSSPYVSSRSTADRSVLDYSRFYGVPTVVLRPDTVAGPRHFETEGRGWIAHFVYSILAGDPVTVYGSGLQVGEVLHVSDLVNALMAARDFRVLTSGNAYNVGGGPSHTVSVNEMIDLIEQVCHCNARVQYAPARPEGRLFYMADSSAFANATGWFPRRSLEQTVREIAAFWYAHRGQVREPRPVRSEPYSYRSAA